MSRKQHTRNATGPQGPSQRQLRAGELIRHALVDVLREEDIHDEALAGVSITVTEVRMSPDLKHAACYVEPLGAGVETAPVAGQESGIIKALNAHARYLRGLLGRRIDMKFTPELKFRHDESFDTASHIDRLLDDPRVRADIERPEDQDGPQAAQGAIGPKVQPGPQAARSAVDPKKD
jgi:ribosome-binding factor A